VNGKSIIHHSPLIVYHLDYMQDIKNFYLAWVSSIPVLAAVESSMLITIISAIILPIVFFAIGKTADILLQIYLQNKSKK
jgi:hypothetical protein